MATLKIWFVGAMEPAVKENVSHQFTAGWLFVWTDRPVKDRSRTAIREETAYPIHTITQVDIEREVERAQ